MYTGKGLYSSIPRTLLEPELAWLDAGWTDLVDRFPCLATPASRYHWAIEICRSLQRPGSAGAPLAEARRVEAGRGSSPERGQHGGRGAHPVDRELTGDVGIGNGLAENVVSGECPRDRRARQKATDVVRSEHDVTRVEHAARRGWLTRPLPRAGGWSGTLE